MMPLNTYIIDGHTSEEGLMPIGGYLMGDLELEAPQCEMLIICSVFVHVINVLHKFWTFGLLPQTYII